MPPVKTKDYTKIYHVSMSLDLMFDVLATAHCYDVYVLVFLPRAHDVVIRFSMEVLRARVLNTLQDVYQMSQSCDVVLGFIDREF